MILNKIEIIGVKYIYLICFIASVVSDNCKVDWIESGKEVSESQYIIELSIINTTGHLRTYFPNTDYDITIKSKLNNKFNSFYFSMINLNKTLSFGNLELRDKELSRFHNGPYCINKIIDGPSNPWKSKIIIGWQSPGVDSGCIEIKANVKETDLRYHTANLTVCQDPRVALDSPGEILKNCCACDEGKYELSFEGLWSRYTHPKHFPDKQLLAVFPAIVGASHDPDYQFWQPYTNASKGLKEFAKSGYTLDLELELKSKISFINTLIKFQGVNYQNKTRKSYAGLRVNNKNHVVSLVAKIAPSPDWFIGVSSLELCQADCTWIKSKTLNLYAYDAGVVDGIVFQPPGKPTDPPDIIQSLNMTWPPPSENGTESPFYDKTNNTHDVRPFATVHFERLRGSEQSCQRSVIINTDCVTEWTPWSDCSQTCGSGYKTRERKRKDNYNRDSCPLDIIERKSCSGQKGTADCMPKVTEEDCEFTEWTEWPQCKLSCGPETATRSRTLKLYKKKKECESLFRDMNKEYKESETTECGNPPCADVEDYDCNNELFNEWSDWNECSVTQGTGVQVRYRTVKEKEAGFSLCSFEKKTCTVVIENPTVNPTTLNVTSDNSNQFNQPFINPLSPEESLINTIKPPLEKPNYCNEPKDDGVCTDKDPSALIRFYYDSIDNECKQFTYTGCGGNKNRFNDIESCRDRCMIYGRPIDCVLSEWEDWVGSCTDCKGTKTRIKKVLVEPKNGGRHCDIKYDVKLCCKESSHHYG